MTNTSAGLHQARYLSSPASGCFAPRRALQSEIRHLQSSGAWRAAAEREAWLEAVTNPDASGLPGRILLADYLGQRRVEVLRGAAFTPLERTIASGLWIIPKPLERWTVKRRERRAPRKARRRRVEVLRDASRQLRTFKPE